MPERGFNTDFWTDPFVVRLPLEAKLLYAYLWTNSRCNQAGLYQIGVETIASETKLNTDDVPGLLQMLSPKVKWYPEQDLIWVKNFIKHQAKSPKFLIAAASRLKDINNNGVIKELLEYNLEKYNISIPYGYCMDTVPISDSDTKPKPNAISSSKSNAEEETGVVKGASLRSESENEESLCEGDQEIISVWRSVKGFKMSPSDASELVAKLRTEFPDINLLEESKAWAARKVSEPLTPKSRPSGQIWNWMNKSREFAQERRESGRASKPGRDYGPRRLPTDQEREDSIGKPLR